MFHVSDARVQHKSRQREKPKTAKLNQQHKKATNTRLRSKSDRRVKHTAEGLKTCQTHQRVDLLNTDHKDVAFTVSSPQKSVLRIKLLNTMMRARLEVPDLHHKPPRRDHASFAALVCKEHTSKDRKLATETLQRKL